MLAARAQQKARAEMVCSTGDLVKFASRSLAERPPARVATVALKDQLHELVHDFARHGTTGFATRP